jgi:hypothetical protein
VALLIDSMKAEPSHQRHCRRVGCTTATTRLQIDNSANLDELQTSKWPYPTANQYDARKTLTPAYPLCIRRHNYEEGRATAAARATLTRWSHAIRA